MPEEFEIGDVVRPKSGGPKMTVQAESAFTPDLICKWFEGTEARTENFRPESLEKVDEES